MLPLRCKRIGDPLLVHAPLVAGCFSSLSVWKAPTVVLCMQWLGFGRGGGMSAGAHEWLARFRRHARQCEVRRELVLGGFPADTEGDNPFPWGLVADLGACGIQRVSGTRAVDGAVEGIQLISPVVDRFQVGVPPKLVRMVFYAYFFLAVIIAKTAPISVDLGKAKQYAVL